MQYWDPIQALFYAENIGGYVGPLIIVGLSVIILSNRKYKPLGIFFLLAEMILLSIYATAVGATPWYWWNIWILVLGMLTCLGQMMR